jgi:SP family facilitated glucose transporter-like MFS transporter 3
MSKCCGDAVCVTSRFVNLAYRWLISHDPTGNEARTVIRKLRGYRHEADVQEEINNFISASKVHKTSRGSAHSSGAMWDLCMSEKYRVLLVAAIGLQMSQQLCGINAVFYYSTDFFKGILDNPLMGTCLVNAVNVLATFVAMKLMDRAHRRTLLLWSSGGMLASCILLTLTLLGYTARSVALGAVILFVTFFEIGLGPIPWLITAEYFDSKYVATAMSLASIVNWGCNFLVGLLFPYIQEALGPYTFVPFGVVLLLTFAFTALYVTESYGRTVDEIFRLVNMGKGQDLGGHGEDIRGKYEMIDRVFE